MWVRESVNSALAQASTSESFCTVRIDGPSACGPEVINWLFSVKKRNRNLKILLGMNRLGTFGSYRAIFNSAKSPFLCQLDADDLLENGIIGNCIDILRSNRKASFCYANYRVINANGEALSFGKRSSKEFNLLRQLVQFETFHPRVIRRESYEAVGGYDRNLQYVGDYDLCLKLAEISIPLHLDIIGYSYRMHSKNTSSIFSENLKSESFQVARSALKRRGLQHLYQLKCLNSEGGPQVKLEERMGPILIAGMHRSGTSAVSSVLKAAGVDLGKQLLRPDKFNPMGYQEDVHAIQVNREVLTSLKLHPDWGYCLASEKCNQADKLREYQNKLKAFIGSRSRDDCYWGWKDPRNTLLLDMWDSIEPGVRVIVLFREPWNVVRSLKARYTLFKNNDELAVATWVLFNKKLLAFIKRNPQRCIAINSTRAIKSPAKLLEASRKGLNLQNLNDSLSSIDADKILKPNIYTQAGCDHDWNDRHPNAMQIYNELEDLSEF